MFCPTCNLNYPEHLNYCRRCGKGLTGSVSNATTTHSLCCTRCGARVMHDESFCQQCGYRLKAKTQETVIGACHNCGEYWRSGWLFCKKCGLDRETALTKQVSTESSSLTFHSNIAQRVEEIPRVEKVHCPKCGNQSQPFSRFCDSCGFNLDTGKLNRPAGAIPPSRSSRSGRSGSLQNTEDYPDQAPSERPDIDSLEYSTVGSEHDIGGNEISASEIPPSEEGPNDWGEETEEFQEAPPPYVPRQPAPRKTGGFRNAGATSLYAEDDYIDEQPTYNSRAQVSARTGQSGPLRETLDATDTANPREPAAGRSSYNTGGLGRDAGQPVVVPSGSKSDANNNLGMMQAIVILGAVSLLTFGILGWWLTRHKSESLVPSSSETVIAPSPESVASPPPATSPVISPTPAVQAPQGMVYVPGGSFLMGRDGGERYETPAVMVSVDPFFIDRNEVTNEEYQKFVSSTTHRAPPHWKNDIYPTGTGKLPVVNVSWDDANAYAAWANKRLPSEAEWELAARGFDGRIYPWGNDWNPDMANAGRGKEGRMAEAGQFASGASPFGAVDMSGNVWEWTADSLFSYADRSKQLAPGKVIRGGAFDVVIERATSTYRGFVPPDRVYDKTGFRCARNFGSGETK